MPPYALVRHELLVVRRELADDFNGIHARLEARNSLPSCDPRRRRIQHGNHARKVGRRAFVHALRGLLDAQKGAVVTAAVRELGESFDEAAPLAGPQRLELPRQLRRCVWALWGVCGVN